MTLEMKVASASSMRLKWLALLVPVLTLSACATNNNITIDQQAITLPAKWQGDANTAEALKVNVSSTLPKPLQALIDVAVAQNPQLKQQYYELQAQKYRARASGASLWPNLDLSVKNSVRQTNEDSDTVESAELSLALQYELDIWGKLSAADQQQNLTLMRLQTQYDASVNALIADVITTYFAVVEAQNQLTLNANRLEVTEQNLAIIESGYEQGLNEALDVYLTRNELANEQSNFAARQQTVANLKRKLQQLVGRYPDDSEVIKQQQVMLDSLPELTEFHTDMIKHHPAIKAGWLSVMASNAALAFAHKQRFPSLSLSLNAGSTAESIGDVIADFDLGWSLIGGLTQPIFNAGRLKANERAAESSLRAVEQNYLTTFLQTFETTERLAANQHSLEQQLTAKISAAKNAQAAQQLSFEQYQKGLVNYATVLTAQSRSFNAQSSVIQLQYQLIENKINLFIALGGKFNLAQSNNPLLKDDVAVTDANVLVPISSLPNNTKGV